MPETEIPPLLRGDFYCYIPKTTREVCGSKEAIADEWKQTKGERRIYVKGSLVQRELSAKLTEGLLGIENQKK